ncbi:MAG: Ribbon-helix-helix protein copG family [Candidatus Poribacteria bacterium]|nr:Ribbon-helix-helix protein copG family [Candidatus Poribacteria bacterium]
MERVTITIPSELLRDIDSERKKLGQNRSEFIRNVVTEYLKNKQRKELENGEEFKELMARGYIEISRWDCDE